MQLIAIANTYSNSADTRVFELDYCGLLNRCLPDDIRAVAWCPVTPSFSARFSATFRVYRYFFVKRNLDIEAMATAAQKLVGEHDFRNFAKLDVLNVSNFRRNVFSAQILLFQACTGDPKAEVYMLEIKGIAFLWHM